MTEQEKATFEEHKASLVKMLEWWESYLNKKMSKLSPLSDRIDAVDGSLDAVTNAQCALDFCEIDKDFLDEIKMYHDMDKASYLSLSKTTDHANTNYFRCSAHMFNVIYEYAKQLAEV